MLGVGSVNIFILTLFVLPFSLPENRPDLLWSRSHQVERQAARSALAQSPPSQIPLYYQESTSTVVLNHCRTRLALYMGRWILMTWSFFEESTYPLNYVGNDALKGSVSSAAFVLDNLAMVIDQRLYIYSLYDDSWIPAQGVDGPVTTVSSLQCCFSRDKACLEVSSAVLLYSLGSPLEAGQVYLSLDGGFHFSRLSLDPQPNEFVGGVFNMPTVSSVVALITTNQSAFSFRYISADGQKRSDQHSLRDPLASLRVVQPAGMRGQLVLWSPRTLLYSPNHGVVVVPVYVIGRENATLPPPDVTILQVATDEHGVMAVLTSEGVLYYGRLALEANMVRFSSVQDTSRESLLLFSSHGDLVLLRAQVDQVFGAVGFSHRDIIVQQELSSARPPVHSCTVEQFHGTFSGGLFYIDMGSTVQLSAVYIPSPLCTFFPLVTVTDSQLLSSEEKCVEDGITPEGTKKYRLDIQLQQLTFSQSEDGPRKPSPRKGSLSTLTVDLMGRHVSCKGLNPLKAHILVGCPPGKHIRILSNVTACTKGHLSQEQLQDNFTYHLPKEVYDPEGLFRPGSASRDLLLSYSITDYYCPLLVYHDVPWMPTLQLWDGDVLVEDVSADFVLFEVNGMHNFQYLQSVQQAKCVSQAQNWTSQLGRQPRPDPHTAWTRDNYKSCQDSDGPPLTDPAAQYQVLNRASGNRLLFSNYNGMYIFKAIVVDPSYSYCELSSVFSVCVSGAFPPRLLPSGAAMLLFLSAAVLLLLTGFLLQQYYRA